MEEIKNPAHYFYTHDGQALKNMRDLFEFLNKTDDGTFAFHFNPERNDFANWVGDTLKMKELSQKMYAAKTREELIDLSKEEAEKPFEAIKEKLESTTEEKPS